MAAIERKDIAESNATNGATNVEGRVVQKKTQLALVKSGVAKNAAGNVYAHAAPRALPPSQDEASETEAEKVEAKGWRAWWRLAQIVRVLGTMSLYLFLNDY